MHSTAPTPPLPDLSEDLPGEAGSEPEKKKTPLYYIDVDPAAPADGRPLPLPALSVFSVISKFMGQYPRDWKRHLRGISDRGYNMIHFTPLQVRGESNSPYSLYDQLGWDPACFPGGEADVQKMVESLENDHSLLSLTDIVLNHTANNSAWLQEHPEAGLQPPHGPPSGVRLPPRHQDDGSGLQAQGERTAHQANLRGGSHQDHGCHQIRLHRRHAALGILCLQRRPRR